jgi:hypothetical protein
MAERTIFIDIETVPAQSPAVRAAFAAAVTAPAQYKKPESIADWLRENSEAEADAALAKTSFDGALGHVLCIAVAIDDAPPLVFCNATCVADIATSEAGTLRDLKQWLAKLDRYDRPVYVGHNLIEFDLRFLLQRSIVHGVPLPLPYNARPWDTNRVYDTMTMWAGLKNRVGLDKLAKALGVGGKDGISGADVWPMVQAGRIPEVCDYCAADVELTRRVYRRMTFQACEPWDAAA